MKKYSTTYSNGHTVESSNANEANNWSFYDDKQIFRISGKVVTSVEFYEAVRSAIQAAYDKKNETHKKIRVRYGASDLCYVTKWVPR